MKEYNSFEDLKSRILRQLQVEFDVLPQNIQKRVGGALARTRGYVKRLDTGVQSRSPSGRARMREFLVGRSKNVADYIDGATGGKPRSKRIIKRRSGRRSRVVGKK